MYGESWRIEKPNDMPTEEASEPVKEESLQDEEERKFDPQAELMKVWDAPREERAAMLAEFKGRLHDQIEGLAQAQTEIIAAIRKEPDMSRENLFGLVSELGARYGMSSQQKELADGIVRLYEYKHEAVKDIREQHPDDRDLFQALFGRPPAGRVEIIQGPMTLYVRCEDIDDYATINSQRFLKNQDAGPEDVAVAKKSRGVSIDTALTPELEGTIIAENSGRLGYRLKQLVDSNETYRHEEQHAIRELFDDRVRHHLRTNRLKEAQTPEEKELALKMFLRFDRERMDYRVSNEILAYCTSPISNKTLFKKLTRPATRGGLYEYFDLPAWSRTYNWIRRLLPPGFSDGIEGFGGWLDDAIEDVYTTEYQALVKSGIESFRRLTSAGYPQDKAIAVLTHEPLARWKKTVDRLLDQNRQ